jgi:SAM-dependent methyltransferase
LAIAEFVIVDRPSSAEVIAANRTAWDDSAPLHRDNELWRRIADGFRAPGYSRFDEQDGVMKRVLAEVGLEGKDVAQICCNNGRELISIKNLGARSAVGFDQSEAFLAQARELNAIAGQECLFVCCDANAIPSEHHSQFDLVVITIGVFGWMPDLPLFMGNAAALLRPKGQLLIYEEHPVATMFDVRSERPLEAVYSYFKQHPFVETRAIVYDGAPAPPVAKHYWFVHPLSEVMTTILKNGLNIEEFREFGNNISSVDYDALEKADQILPLSYLLKARKG